LRVLIVTGIYPPDIGGPATHAADLREELVRRGHRVRVLTVGDDTDVRRESGLIRLPRRWPWPVRQAAVVREVFRQANRLDAVYATGLHAAAVAAARLSGVPVVVKIVGDPAWERGQRRGLTRSRFEAFRSEKGGSLELRAMRALRNWTVRTATQVVVPSEFLRDVVERWADGLEVRVIPNGVSVPSLPPRDHSSEDVLRVLYVGRLVPVKQVANIIRAVARTSRIELQVVGDGPEGIELEKLASELGATDRVRFRGALPHPDVLKLLAQADALVLASDVEGLPHAVIEALAVGTPVVAPPVGGVPEVVRHRVSGIMVETPSEHDLAPALAEMRDDPSLRKTLFEGASKAGLGWRFEISADRIEELVSELALTRPRVVFLGKTRVPDGRAEDFDRKMSILANRLEPVLVAVSARWGAARRSGATILMLPDLRPPLLGGLFFYTCGPLLALSAACRSRPSAIVCQSPFEAVGINLLRSVLPAALRPPLVVEVHGDWRTAARLYGSSARRWVAPIADALAGWAIKRADGVRVIGDFTAELVRAAGYTGSIDRYVAFGDFESFIDEPLAAIPNEPRVAFVGVLEANKAVDVLIDAWAIVVARLPRAVLTLAGAGTLDEQLRIRALRLGLAEHIRFLGRLTREGVRELIDGSTCLVLPSLSEGLGRVILEAMARSRPVVATRVGGIPELVEDGINGRLIDARDRAALAAALIDVLSDRERTEAMGAAGRQRVLHRHRDLEFASGIERLADWIVRR
jgi:glycosyltransferase involved in cell wall biosynthesis